MLQKCLTTTHLDANLTTHGSDRRYLFRIRLTSGKLKHISQIKRRISYRVRIKGHTIHHRYDIQPKIPYQLYICQPMLNPKSSIISF